MNSRQNDMKFTDQIERELMQRCATQASGGEGIGNPASAFTEGGPWLTVAILAIATVIWVLATQ